MSRPLSDIPNGATVMVNANILAYALTPQALLHGACRDLLERGARGAVSLFTSVSVTADVLHRAMVLEVLAQGQAQRWRCGAASPSATSAWGARPAGPGPRRPSTGSSRRTGATG